jgi:hypothetical protein
LANLCVGKAWSDRLNPARTIVPSYAFTWGM